MMLEGYLLVIAVFITPAVAEPCTEYTELDDSHRSSSYTTDGSLVLCDVGRIVQGNWYRFTSYVGGKIPEECMDPNSCGTQYPVWMNGQHPSEVNPGPLEVQACVNTGSCCDHSLDIRVKWCKNGNNKVYYVYELAELPACNTAYCAGCLPACDYGKVWNNFQLDCVDETPEFDGTGNILLSDPVEPANSITGKFHFECHIPYKTDKDVGVRFLVAWLFDGIEAEGVPQTVVNGLSAVAILSEDYLRGQIGKELSCRVQVFWHGIDLYGDSYESNSYWMGIRATHDITVVEGQGVEETILYSTLPITCGCCSIFGACFYNFKLSDLTFAKSFSCSYSFSVSEPNPTLKVEALYTPGRGFPKEFAVEFAPFEDISNDRSIWDGYQIEPVYVTVVDDMIWRQCEIYGDPYIMTFDGHNYEMRETGQFNILKTDTDLQIHGRFKECESGLFASCLCAIAVRYRNNVVGVDACNGDPYDANSFEKFINIDNSYINFNNHGVSFEIWFDEPQTYIEVWSSPDMILQARIDTFISWGSTSGLCGTVDDNWQNDFDPFSIDNYESFYHLYRIPDTLSFFDGVSECDSYATIETPCECDRNTQELRCGNTGSNVENNFGNVCDLENRRKKRSVPRRLHERSVDVDYADNIADFYSVMGYSFINVPANFPEVTWPTASGITESYAESWCLTVLQMSPAFQLCASLTDMDHILYGCKSDIKVTDNLDTAYTKVTTMEKNCAFVAESNQVYGAENEAEAIELIESIKGNTCPNLCSFHGSCVDGKCECFENYFGTDCSVEVGLTPVISSIENSGLCDMQDRPCAITRIQATPLMSVNYLVCRIKHVLLSEDGEHRPYANAEITLPARLLNQRKVECSLPVSPVSPTYSGGFYKTEHGFMVSVSLDGEHFSEEVLLVVYDSMCRMCYTNGSCITKESTCVMSGQCYHSDDCTDYGVGNDTDKLPDSDKTAKFLVDDESLLMLNDNMDEVKETLAYHMNLHCIVNPVACCRAMGFDVNSISESGLFQWTDASLCVIDTEEIENDETIVLIAMAVPMENAELLCGMESTLSEDHAYFDGSLITTVISESQDTIDEEHGVEFLVYTTTTEPDNEDAEGTDMALVGGIIGGCLALVAIVVIVVIIWKKKKQATAPAVNQQMNQPYTNPCTRENSWMTDTRTVEPGGCRTDLNQESVIQAAPPQSTVFDLNQMSILQGSVPHGRLQPLE